MDQIQPSADNLPPPAVPPAPAAPPASASFGSLYGCAAAAGLIGMTIVSWGLDVSQCRRRFRAYFVQYILEALLRAAAIILVLHGIKGVARNSEAVLWLMGAGVTVAAMLSLLIERQ